MSIRLGRSQDADTTRMHRLWLAIPVDQGRRSRGHPTIPEMPDGNTDTSGISAAAASAEDPRARTASR